LGKGLEGQFLNLSAFGNYLLGKPLLEEPTKSNRLYQPELRVGIKLAGGRRAAETGMLYMAEFVRPVEKPEGKSRLLVQVNLPDNLFRPGLLALGGEGRAASCGFCPKAEDSFKEITNENGRIFKQLLQKVKESGRFKLYLASPAIFQKGWLPDFFRPLNGEYQGERGSLQVRLVAATVGKAVSIGGWDLAEQKPKPIQKAVPAGSVYFLEALESLDDKKITELFGTFHFTTALQQLSSFSSLAQIGFGLTFIGTWDPVETEGRGYV
jgi:CRISPR-associated protein Cmr3